MDYLNIIQLICSAVLFLIGIIQLATKKCVGTRTSDYTVESIKKFAFISGILYVVIGMVTGALCGAIIYFNSQGINSEILETVNKYVLPFDVFVILIAQFAILKKNKK